MGITVAEPCFDSENESSAKLCAEGSERFEHLLLRPETDPQTDCSDDVSAAPRHSTAQYSTAHRIAGHDTTPHHTTAIRDDGG